MIERDGKLLLERRTDAPVWSLIAGKVEDDESLIEGLVREVAEETGLTVSGYSFFGHYSDPSRIVAYPDGNVFSVATFAYVVGVESFEGLRPSAESHELRFFSKADLHELDMPATQQEVIEHYRAGSTAPILA